MEPIDSAISEKIEKETGQAFQPANANRLGGGCIHNARCLSGEDGRRFFIKQNDPSHEQAFAAEAYSLSIIASTQTVRVPEPVGTCHSGSQCALILEFLPMGGPRHPQRLGRNLARLHRQTNESFGWSGDNWIGSTPQKNKSFEEWTDFYRECRLRPQMEMARNNGLSLSKGDQLLGCLPRFFESYAPRPSLLHGDLWGGNADYLEDGTPVIFDPAAYYGDREADLAMTELFGGFGPLFHEAYNSEWPVDRDYRIRKVLYNLYHVLNHYNLFGGGYGQQSESMIGSLLKAVS